MVGKLTPDDIVSASTVPALLGLNPYHSPNDLLKQCIEASRGEYVSDFNGNEATRWGDRLEPVVLTQAAERLELMDVELDPRVPFHHETLPLAASLDGRAFGRGELVTDTARGIYCINADRISIDGMGVLESKVTRSAPEVVPPPYRGPLQLQAQMMCTGYKWGAIATFYGGIELRLFVYRADPVVQRRIADAVIEFEERKRNIDWYPVINSADGNTAYPRVDDGAHVIDLAKNADGEELLRMLVKARADKALAELNIDEAEAGLKEIMGSHEYAEGMVGNQKYRLKWGMRTMKAKPERVMPAEPERTVRSGAINVKEV